MTVFLPLAKYTPPPGSLLVVSFEQILIGKYKEAQGSIKGLQTKVQELEAQKAANPAASEGGAGEGGTDPSAFGATIAALQTQLREVTQDKEEAQERARVAAEALESSGRSDGAGVGGGGGGGRGDGGATPAVAQEQHVQALETSLGEKQAQNEQLVAKVRQLFTRCRSLQEEKATAAAASAAAAVEMGESKPTVDAAAFDERIQGLQEKLQSTQRESEKVVSRLQEVESRYRALQSRVGEGEDGALAASPPPPPPSLAVDGDATAAFDAAAAATAAERLADAERRVEAADERAAELARRCEEAEAGQDRAAGSLKEALQQLAGVESSPAAAASVAEQGGSLSQEQLRTNNASLEERVRVLVEELRGSREEKEEVSTQLVAKSVERDNLVSNEYCGEKLQQLSQKFLRERCVSYTSDVKSKISLAPCALAVRQCIAWPGVFSICRSAFE